MIIRHSIQKKYIEGVEFDPSNLQFGGMFGGDFRRELFIGNPALSQILDLLSSGKTKSGSKYKVNLSDNTATKEGDKRTWSAGRVIGKELGKEYLDEWSRQVASVASASDIESLDRYRIILSRHPIDIMRMSDHDGISSCHSPGESYFNCALEESKSGGIIAYIVLAKDLENVDLQADDIFEDIDRNISGIVPLSRLRVNRYKIDGYTFLVPGIRVYGRVRLSGFYETVKEWLKRNQPNLTIDIVEKNFINVERSGGHYSDYNDDDLFNEFFDTDDFHGNASYIGEDHENEDLVEIWNNEIQEMINQVHFNNIEVYAEAHISDNIVYISAMFAVTFSFEDFNSSFFSTGLSYFDKTKFFSNLFRDELGSVPDVENMGNGDIRISFDIDPENPDDLYNEIQTFKSFEENNYQRFKYIIYNWFVDHGIIEKTELHEKTINENFNFNNLSLDWDGEGLYNVSFNIPISGIPNDLMLVYNIKYDIVTKLKSVVWPKLLKSYNTFISQPSLFDENEDLSISSQFPRLLAIIETDQWNEYEIRVTWEFYVHDYTIRNQKVIMNFLNFLDNNFENLSEAVYNDSVAIIDNIVKNVPGPYHGKNWYERSQIWEDKLRKGREAIERNKNKDEENSNSDSPDAK